MLKNLPTGSQLKVGDFVKIEQKHNRNTGHLDEGIIEEFLTRGEEHPYGIMVLLTDGKIGRVKEKPERGLKPDVNDFTSPPTKSFVVLVDVEVDF